MRDRLTMARRVRGYVLGSKRFNGSGTSLGGAGSATARERKALATMGRRGGQKAAERWKDRNSNYAKSELRKLAKANATRKVKGQSTRARVMAAYSQSLYETGRAPSAREVAEEVGCERSTASKHLSALRKAGMLPSLGV